MAKSLQSYPESSWRPHQREYSELLCRVCEGGGERRIGLESPCGSGKSLGYLRAIFSGRCPPAFVLSTTRQHLNQIEQTLQTHFAESAGFSWEIIRGRDFYPCCGQKSKTEREEAREPSGTLLGQLDVASDPDPEQMWAAPPKCKLGRDCEYRQAVIKAAASQVVVQCTIGALYRMKYWAQLAAPLNPSKDWDAEFYHARKALCERELCVLDEAHEYFGVRRAFRTTELGFAYETFLSRDTLRQLDAARMKGNYRAGYVLLTDRGEGERPTGRTSIGVGPSVAIRMAEDVRAWLAPEKVAMLRTEIAGKVRKAWMKEMHTKALEDLESPGVQDAIEAEINAKVREHTGKLETFVYLFGGGERPDNVDVVRDVVSIHFEGGRRGWAKVVNEPLWADTEAKIAPIEVFTSATLRDVRSLLRIEKKEVKAFAEIFDWSRAVEVTPVRVAATGRGNTPLGPDELKAIYYQEGRPLTIVLFLSKKQAEAATASWAAGARRLLRQSTPQDLQSYVEQCREYQDGIFDERSLDQAAPMLVCYGGWVGLDIPGHKWLVIGSAPLTPLTPVFEARAARSDERVSAWQDFEKQAAAATQLKQGLGRLLRSAEDSGRLIWPLTYPFQDLGLNPKTGQMDA